VTPAVLWAPFVAYWALAARDTRQTRPRVRGAPSPLRGVLYFVGGALIFLAPSLGPLDDRFVPAVVEVGAAGWVLTAVGMLFSIWARVSLGRNWSGRVVVKQEHELVSRGPYALVRHPIYTGLLVALTGTALYDGRWRALLGVALFTIGFWLKARSEENLLEGEFGDDYRTYRARTPMLIPNPRVVTSAVRRSPLRPGSYLASEQKGLRGSRRQA
jgi:protein-S-isoprenylcysteine O-methyltransferase Ste14